MRRAFITLIVLASLSIAIPRATQAAPRQALAPEFQCFYGTLYAQFGLIVDALPLLDSGVMAMKSTTPTPPQLGECALWLGAARHSIGDWNGALDAYALARKQFEARGDVQMIWTTWYGTASLYMAQGHFAEGRATLEEHVLPGLDDTSSWITPGLAGIARAASHNNYGVILGSMGDYAEAELQINLALDETRTLIRSPSPADNTSSLDPHDLLLLLRFSEHLAAGDENISDPMTLMKLFELARPLVPVDQSSSDSGTSAELDAAQAALEQILNGETPSLPPQAGGDGSDIASQPMLAFAAKLAEWLQNPSSANSESNAFPIALDQVALLNEVTGSMAQAFEPMMLNNLGELARKQNNLSEAQQYFQQALDRIDKAVKLGPIIPTNAFYDAVRALVLNNLGMAHIQAGDDSSALTAFYKAADIMRRLNMRVMLASTLSNTSAVRQQRGELETALRDTKEAVDAIEKTRVIAESNTVNLVASQGSSTANAYALSGTQTQMIDVYDYAVLLNYRLAQDASEPDRQRYLYDAFAYAERSRARLFLETTARSNLALSNPSIAQLMESERRDYVMQQVAEDTLTQMQQVKPPSPLLPDFQEQKDRADAQYAASRTALEDQAPRLMTFTGAQSGALELPDVQKLLDEDTTLVSFFSFDPRIFPDEPPLAFIITRNELQVAQLPLGTPKLLQGMMSKLPSWRAAAPRNPTDATPRVLRDMYTAIIAPIRNQITTANVGIVPHQALHYIPFAGLSDENGTYFGEQKNLFYLPSASAYALVQANTRQNAPTGGNIALVMGEPATDPALGLIALDFAHTEVISISSLLHSSPITDTNASEATLKANIADRQIVHIAAHGLYSVTNVLDSAVYLAPGHGEDGALRANEVYGLDARRTDLVVLSACDTNVGSSPAGNVTTSSAATQPISTGDEVLSLGRAFLTAGASSVIASLWNVDDASTAALMHAFYHYWQEERRPKAEALRLAQADVRAKWPNPYFWAGFVLNGDPSLGRAHVLVQQTPTVQIAPTQGPAAAQPTVPQQEMSTDAASARVTPQSPTPNRTPAAGGLCGIALVMVGLSIGAVSLRRKRNWME